ncbi:hypothetical protein F4808DRAFT_347553 [Astrocystis sublimbata]|nr:hypothetical protein F4808DRAFT_347553 [Astrocystis sublimbata]
MFENLTIRDVPALIAGFTLTLGGFTPFISASWSMLEIGFSPRVASSPAAALPMIIFGSRTTMVGALIVIFYSQGKFDAVDTVLLTTPYTGLVEGYLVWKEGRRGKAVFRAVTGFLFGACGMAGLTAANR